MAGKAKATPPRKPKRPATPPPTNRQSPPIQHPQLERPEPPAPEPGAKPKLFTKEHLGQFAIFVGVMSGDATIVVLFGKTGVNAVVWGLCILAIMAFVFFACLYLLSIPRARLMKASWKIAVALFVIALGVYAVQRGDGSTAKPAAARPTQGAGGTPSVAVSARAAAAGGPSAIFRQPGPGAVVPWEFWVKIVLTGLPAAGQGTIWLFVHPTTQDDGTVPPIPRYLFADGQPLEEDQDQFSGGTTWLGPVDLGSCGVSIARGELFVELVDAKETAALTVLAKTAGNTSSWYEGPTLPPGVTLATLDLRRDGLDHCSTPTP